MPSFPRFQRGRLKAQAFLSFQNKLLVLVLKLWLLPPRQLTTSSSLFLITRSKADWINEQFNTFCAEWLLCIFRNSYYSLAQNLPLFALVLRENLCGCSTVLLWAVFDGAILPPAFVSAFLAVWFGAESSTTEISTKVLWLMGACYTLHSGSQVVKNTWKI